MVKKGARAPYHHGDLRHALLVAAAKLVEEEGVEALTLRELARRVGVSHAAPAHHFTDKGGLLAELAADGFESLGRRLTACSARRAGDKRLRDVGRAYIEFAREQPGHYRIMFGRALAEAASSPRLAEAGARAFRALEEAVLGALPTKAQSSRESVRQAAFLAWSAVHGASMLILDQAILADLAPRGDEQALETLVQGLTSAVAEAIGKQAEALRS
jgi:AcrR family transcriptional regulator